MFRHVVLLKWKDDATPEQRQAAADGIRGLPDVVPGIRRFAVGLDVGMDPNTYDLVIVADFDDAAGYAAYRDNPDHRALIHNVTGPILAARAAVQHELA